MIISYDGREYNGWQKQKNATTIQSTLEKALTTFLKKETTTTASGRTDTGVSAYAQPVHFDVDSEIVDLTKFKRSMNGILPKDIKVLHVLKSDLHARFDAKKKTYLYKMYVSDVELPLMHDAFSLSTGIDIKEMKAFAKLMKGTHDFKGFQSSGSPTDSTIRTVYDARLKREGRYLNFYITGNGFLYKMVRNIVGCMIEVGLGKIKINDIKNDLFTSFKSAFTSKAEYLYLLNVKY